MRALLSYSPGGPETLALAELPDPKPGPGDLLVRVRACSINYPDALIIEDKYQLKPPRPFAPGSEVAGEVEAVGDAVEGWSVGDRLIAATGYGGLVEKIIVPAKSAIPLPAARSFEEGSALLLTYATSIHALLDRGKLQAGHTLLVLGAAGGVGIAAVEIGKAVGARVVAAVSSEEKAAAAREAGAAEAVIYPSGPFDRDGLKALSQLFKDAVGPAGADVIFDPVGGDYTEAALRSIAWEGRFLVVGFPAVLWLALEGLRFLRQEWRIPAWALLCLPLLLIPFQFEHADTIPIRFETETVVFLGWLVVLAAVAPQWRFSPSPSEGP